MAKVFISSSYQDLRDYREAIYVALRHLGHQSVAMEQWAASDTPAMEQSLHAVRSADVLLALVGWRYGYIPAGERYSLTELELRAAQEADIPCFVFMVGEETPWPREYVDDDATRIRRFRDSLLERYTVAFFDSPDELATRVSVALHRWVSTGAATPSFPVAPTEATEEPPGPEVFVSYAHEDLAVAQAISERIGRERWSVFWDREIPVGLTWDDIVEAALDGAHCVVVLWSKASRDSDWVRIEAMEGAERKILAPALIEETKIPLRFRRIQAADLTGWTSSEPDTPGMLALIAAIRRYVA